MLNPSLYKEKLSPSMLPWPTFTHPQASDRMSPPLRSLPGVLSFPLTLKWSHSGTDSHVFSKPHFLFFPGTELDYISQSPLVLGRAMWLEFWPMEEGQKWWKPTQVWPWFHFPCNSTGAFSFPLFPAEWKGCWGPAEVLPSGRTKGLGLWATA